MSKQPDFRDFLVKAPSCPEATQREHLDGTVYRDFGALLRSVRSGSIVRVYRPYLLGGGIGRTDKQRNLWALRADQIKAKGGVLTSIQPALTGHKLAMRAYEEIGNVARGKAGYSKSGRPPKTYSLEHQYVIEKHWPPRKGMTGDLAIAKINELISPRKVTRGWLYRNVKL